MKHFEGNMDGWELVINTIYELFPWKDMTVFAKFCNKEEYGIVESDKDGIINLGIILNVKDDDEYDGEYAHKGVIMQRLAHKGYLPKQMWAEHKQWLEHRPKEMERFKQFEVRILYLFVCNFYVLDY